MKNTTQSLKTLVLALILSLGLNFAYAWVAPTAPPPNGNADAPITTGSTAQTKTGTLTVQGLKIPGSAVGQVLTAIDSAGTVAWQSPPPPPPPSPGDDLGNHTATQQLNMNSNNIAGANNITSSGNLNVGGSVSASGSLSTSQTLSAIGNIMTSGTITAIGSINASGNLTTQGNMLTMGNMSTAGSLFVSGSIDADSPDFYIGNRHFKMGAPNNGGDVYQDPDGGNNGYTPYNQGHTNGGPESCVGAGTASGSSSSIYTCDDLDSFSCIDSFSGGSYGRFRWIHCRNGSPFVGVYSEGIPVP